jgi:hypothetical protein
MFLNHEEVKGKWIFAQGLTNEEEIRKNPQLIYHASKIIEQFSHAISIIDQINSADFESVIKLGKKHYSYGVHGRDFIVTSTYIIFVPF